MFIALAVLIRMNDRAHFMVCPLLTIFVYYYLCQIDYSTGSKDVIYYSLIMGLTAQFFILVMFSETWILSTLFFAPCLLWFMLETQSALKKSAGKSVLRLVGRCLF